jgi:peptidyl-prolyl cis-trans isomerase C
VKKTVWLVLALFGISALSACGSGSRPAAMVNGETITVKEIDDRFSSLSPAVRDSIGNDKSKVLDQLVMESLLMQEARKRRLEADQEVVRLMHDARKQILFGRLFELLRKEDKTSVPEEQIAQFYEKNKSSFSVPATLRTSHILLNDEETAQQAQVRLKAGEPFAKVAQEMSVDPSKQRGGDIGYFAKGQVIPEFEKACESLKIGEVSRIVKTPLGYHIILLTERREAREKSLDEVRDQIHQVILSQQSQKFAESYVQQLRAKAQIKRMGPYSAPAAPAASAQ